jgi:hypothetical protein
MLLRKTLLLSVQLAFAVAELNETIEGYRFIEAGPKIVKTKAEYELDAARIALSVLKQPAGPNDDFDMDNARLATIKQSLGPDGLLSLLQPDIESANKFWHDVISNSTADRWVPITSHIIGFLPNLTAAEFALWSSSSLADKADQAGEPEHYVKTTKVTPLGLSATILEGWGGLTTYFSIPDYSLPPNRVKYPFLALQPDYPIQAAGGKVLNDGTNTTFSVLHISVKDVPAAAYDAEYNGVDIMATLWYNDGAPDDRLEWERQHMVVETVNFLLQAMKDVSSGALLGSTVRRGLAVPLI